MASTYVIIKLENGPSTSAEVNVKGEMVPITLEKAEETEVAEATGKALQDIGVKKVIYMSGLGNKKDALSKHLASRHNTGEILKKYINQVIEFRASMIIGERSASSSSPAVIPGLRVFKPLLKASHTTLKISLHSLSCSPTEKG